MMDADFDINGLASRLRAEARKHTGDLRTDRIKAAWKREQELLRSCARWISTHDIYGNMSKELLEECANVLDDDGEFLELEGEDEHIGKSC